MLPLLVDATLVCNSLDADAPRAYRLRHDSFQIFHTDFDGDGWRDVAGGIETTVLSGKAFSATVAGDFNGDGRLDVLSGDTLVFTATPGCGSPQTVPGLGRDRVAGDLNDDGATDLVAMEGRSSRPGSARGPGCSPARAEWTGTDTALLAIERLRRFRPVSLVFGTRELLEVGDALHPLAHPSRAAPPGTDGVTLRACDSTATMPFSSSSTYRSGSCPSSTSVSRSSGTSSDSSAGRTSSACRCSSPSST